MLEFPSLLIRPHPQAAPPPAPARRVSPAQARQLDIIEPISGTLAGEAIAGAARPWLAWLLPGPIRVCENEDRSLVFTLQRAARLSPTWIVLDAERRHVGTVLRPGPPWFGRPAADWGPARIEESAGRCLASLDAASGEFLSPGGIELAALQRRDSDVELTFADATQANPFSRMLLLAAALVCELTS